MVTAKRAWRGLTYPQIVRMVGIDDARPELPDAMPHLVKELMQDCWSKDPAARPTFRELLQRMMMADAAGLVANAQEAMKLEVDQVSGFF
jgi:hypothetical protein